MIHEFAIHPSIEKGIQQEEKSCKEERTDRVIKLMIGRREIKMIGEH
jgi:hypothetical protein